MVGKLDENSNCLTVFIDLAKAFDTVSVPVLISKLHDLGVSGILLALLSSYLTGRTQSVGIGDNISDEFAVTYRMPQGSKLGHRYILFFKT